MNLCEFDVTDIIDMGIQTIQPCTKNVMSYLEGAYACIDGTCNLSHILYYY